MESVMIQQALAPNMFTYTHEPHNTDSRRNMHFVHHPYAHHPAAHQMHHVFPVVPTLPSNSAPPSRPELPSSQMQQVQQKSHPILLSALTPLPSPQPITQRPVLVTDNIKREDDGIYSGYPATPPLSSSSSAGSVISSPGSLDMIQTPNSGNPMLSGLDGFESKNGYEVDSISECFAPQGWASCTTPPLTPSSFLQSQTRASRLNSTATSCTSLSPSPALLPKTLPSSGDSASCDPRSLTFGSVNSTLAPESVPSFSSDDEHNDLAAPHSTSALPTSDLFDFGGEPISCFEGIQDFGDLLTDDLLAGDFDENPEPESTSTPNNSPTDLVSSFAGKEEGIEDLDFNSFAACLPSPTSSQDNSCDEPPSKRQRTDSSGPTMTSAADSQSGSTQQGTPPADSQSGNASEPKNGSESNSDNGPNTPNTSNPAPTNRRGRKQSLTEDPSKTFACELCSRRFRRQEHLKRHYRSLHTEEKPFECHDCGKKFSRSDNLAQHARTHGSGSFPLDLISEHDAMPMGSAYHPGFHHMMAGPMPHGPPDINQMASTLFQISSEVPGSDSDPSSDEDSTNGKKRKRPEYTE